MTYIPPAADQAEMFEAAAAPTPPVPTDYEGRRSAEMEITQAFYAKMRQVAGLLGFEVELSEGADTYSWPQPVRLLDPRHPGRGYSARKDGHRIEIHGMLGHLSDHMRHGGDYGDLSAEMTVSDKRSPKDIAGEIYNRIYTPYLDLLRTLEMRKAASDADSTRKREIGRVLEAAGGPGARYVESEDGRTMIKIAVTQGYNLPYGTGPRAEAKVITYDRERVDMNLTDLPVELAERIMQTIGEYTS